MERCVFTANGEIQAQQVQAFLESAGIQSMLRGESLRKTHGLTFDGLGSVEILVDVEGQPVVRLVGAAEGHVLEERLAEVETNRPAVGWRDHEPDPAACAGAAVPRA